jgi:hypothetical protein
VDVASPQTRSVDVASPQRVSVKATVIRAPKTRHGTRPEWGKRQHVQIAILALYPAGLPVPMNYLKLTKEVKDLLKQKHGFTVNRDTVRRAVKANRAQGSPDLR